MDYYANLEFLNLYFNHDNFKVLLNFCIGNFGIYMLWIIAHYIAAHIYIYGCVPSTVVGILMSPFLVPAPHCYGLRWVIYQGGNSIIAMWTIAGLWILSRIIPIQS